MPREKISKVGLTMYIKVKPHSVVDPAQNTKGILYHLDGDHLIITNITTPGNGKLSCVSLTSSSLHFTIKHCYESGRQKFICS